MGNIRDRDVGFLAKLAVEQMLGLCEKSAEQTVDITLSSELIPRDSVMRLD